MTCLLVSTNDAHPAITLHNGTPVILGRSPDTGITDQRVSRKQVSVTYDKSKSCVTVKQLGTKPSCVDDQVIGQGCSVVLLPSKTLFLLRDTYGYKVKYGDIKHSEKRKSDEEYNSKRKHAKLAEEPKCDDNDSSDDSENAEEKLAKMRKMLAGMKPTETEGATKNESVAPGKRGTPTAKEKHYYLHEEKLFVYTSVGICGSSKIAGFDIDNTIICTKSGKVFPVDIKDWKIMYPEIKGKLQKLDKDGYKIVFFTNQSGISRGRLKLDDFRDKLRAIIKECKVPVQVYTATGGGWYRKPSPQTWKYLEKHENDSVPIDRAASFYVGDAAGRPAKWAPGRKKDFACSDRLFALNADVDFYTPEEFFLKYRKAEFSLPDFDPRKLSSSAPLCKPEDATITYTDRQEIVVFVGFPACGKSYFAKTYMVPKGYVHVNQDTLGTWQKCVSACEDSVHRGKSVVIDNTNLNTEARQRYLSIAKRAGVSCRCFRFTASFTHCRHNEKFREMTDKSHKPINDMIMNSLKNKVMEPKKEEGFSEIVYINFVPKFSDKTLESLYKKFLL